MAEPRVSADALLAGRPKQRAQALVAAFKAAGCADCGAKPDDSSLLHCHHVSPEAKRGNVSRIASRVKTPGGVRRVAAELLLCEPLCQPCHTERHRKLAAARA